MPSPCSISTPKTMICPPPPLNAFSVLNHDAEDDDLPSSTATASSSASASGKDRGEVEFSGVLFLPWSGNFEFLLIRNSSSWLYIRPEIGVVLDLRKSGDGTVSYQNIASSFELDRKEAKELEADPQGDVHNDADVEGNEEEEEECAFQFKTGVNPLDFVGDGASEVQLYQQFESMKP